MMTLKKNATWSTGHDIISNTGQTATWETAKAMLPSYYGDSIIPLHRAHTHPYTGMDNYPPPPQKNILPHSQKQLNRKTSRKSVQANIITLRLVMRVHTTKEKSNWMHNSYCLKVRKVGRKKKLHVQCRLGVPVQ